MLGYEWINSITKTMLCNYYPCRKLIYLTVWEGLLQILQELISWSKNWHLPNDILSEKNLTNMLGLSFIAVTADGLASLDVRASARQVMTMYRPCIWVNSLRLTKNGCHFLDAISKWIFLNENVWILIKFIWSLFIWVQLTIFQHCLLTHICVTRPQWVK